MRKQREREEMDWLMATGKKHDISLDTLMPVYYDLLDRIFPEIERSTVEARQAAYSRIADYIDNLEADAEMTVAEGIRVGELIPTSRSDKAFTRKTMRDNGALIYTGSASPRFIKRLTHANGGTDKTVAN